MKQTLTQISLMVLVFAGLCGLGLLPTLQAGEGCSTASLQGRYGSFFSDTRVPSPFASVGVFAFDGAGGFTGSYTQSTNGQIQRGTFSGTYTVNDDCTGSDAVTFDTGRTAAHDFVIVDEGRQILFLGLGPRVLDSLAKRQDLEDCTAASYAGTYGYNGSGTLVIGPNPGWIGVVGRMVVDGKGMFEGADTFSMQGQTTHRTYTAEYTVNPDCTGFYDAQTSLGPVRSDFVIVGSGEELFVIRTNPGETLTFTFKKK